MECSVLTKFVFELIGTMVMILMGDGVCACVTLNKSKGQNSGWVVITLAWGLAVGYWNDVDEIKSQWQEERRFAPVANKQALDAAKAGWVDAIARTLSKRQ